MAKTLVEFYSNYISKQANDLKYAGQPLVEETDDGHEVVSKKNPATNLFITHHKNGIRVATRWAHGSFGVANEKHESEVSKEVRGKTVPHGLSPEKLKKTLNAHAEASGNKIHAKDIDAYSHPIGVTDRKTGEYVHKPNSGITTRHDKINVYPKTKGDPFWKPGY
jgi:hypothetical protein